MIRILTKLFAFTLFAQPLCADDFNRPNVAYTHDGSKLGWYWQASGNGYWSLKDHRIHVNNADRSRQETDQVLYHTRVLLKSGDWSATVAVRSATAGHHAGMVFMVGANGTTHYQIELKDSSIKGGNYKGAGIGVNQIAVFEVANQRYPGNPHIEALLKSVDRAAVDVGGYSETYFCKPTLTHGVPLHPTKEEAANPKKP